MDVLMLSRLQFAAATFFHFLFVPLTLGLSVLIAIIETVYLRTGDEDYRRMARFWGKIFIVNFAVGVVTGITLANGNTQLVPTTVSGTLEGFQLVVMVSNPSITLGASILLHDGLGNNLWFGNMTFPAASYSTQPFTVTGLSKRFYNGIVMQITNVTATGSTISPNIYYSVP